MTLSENIKRQKRSTVKLLDVSCYSNIIIYRKCENKDGGVIGSVQRGDMSPMEVMTERHNWLGPTIPQSRGSCVDKSVNTCHITPKDI